MEFITKSTAYIGGGSFWNMQAIYDKIEGVIDTSVGYMGGTKRKKSFKASNALNDGYAEIVKIDFDPTTISYEQLLEIFWKVHDPTTFHRQGNDVGSQFRSIIFATDLHQYEKAMASMEAQQKEIGRKEIVTEILMEDEFRLAPTADQKFWEKQESHPYHKLILSPKLQKVLPILSTMVKLKDTGSATNG